jgi:hypothetical protein
MNEERKKTPINTMRDFDINTRLTSILQQAYHRRSRNQPANLNDIVETLKGDLLKAYPDVPIEVVDDAIVLETLHNPDTQLSPTFFFNAVKKAWFTPKTNSHQWDGKDEDLAYWEGRVRFLERAGLSGSPQHREAQRMVEHYRHGDTEQDTISLLDTCASMLAKMDAAEANGQVVAKKAEFKGVVVDLPAFNSRREYCYLVMRKQLAPDAAAHFFTAAVQAVNADRMDSRHHRLEKAEAATDPDVMAKCQRLAVLDWLRSCNTKNTSPSAILTPMADELSYYQFRRTR